MIILALALLVGFFSSSWISLVSTTLGLAILATGVAAGMAGGQATPSGMAQTFLFAWAGATALAGIAYLFKRLFVSGRKRRRKVRARPPVEQAFD